MPELRGRAVRFDGMQAIYGVWRYDTPLYMGAMAEMMRRRGAPPGDVPKDLPQRQLVCARRHSLILTLALILTLSR